MKPFKTLIAFILGTLTLFSISSSHAGGCNSHTYKKSENECLTDDKKCIDAKDKEILYKNEA